MIYDVIWAGVKWSERVQLGSNIGRDAPSRELEVNSYFVAVFFSTEAFSSTIRDHMKWVSGWIESNFEALIHWSCAVFRIRSRASLSLNSLTDSLTDCCLLDFIDVTLACEDTNSNLLRLLMLVLRNLLTKVWCRCGSWSLVMKLNFCSDFEH